MPMKRQRFGSAPNGQLRGYEPEKMSLFFAGSCFGKGVAIEKKKGKSEGKMIRALFR